MIRLSGFEKSQANPKLTLQSLQFEQRMNLQLLNARETQRKPNIFRLMYYIYIICIYSLLSRPLVIP